MERIKRGLLIIKQDWKQIMIFAILVGFCFPITFETTLTNSGKLYIYVSYPLALILFFIVAYEMLFKSKQIKNSREKKIAAIFVGVLIIWSITITIERYIMGMMFYKAFEAFFISIVPLCIYAIVYDKDELKKTIKYANYAVTAIILVVLLACISKQTLITTVLVNRNMVIYVYLIGFLFAGLLPWVDDFTGKAKWSSLFNMVFLTVYCLASGSRMGAYICLLTVLVIIISSKSENRTRYLICLGVAGLMLVTMFCTNLWGIRYYVDREFKIDTIISSIRLARDVNEKNGEAVDNSINELVNTEEAIEDNDYSQEEKAVRNDAYRFTLWIKGIERIKEAPLFGTGELGVFVADDSNQAPHNFIIEYAIVYGLGGLLIWIIFVIMLAFRIFFEADIKGRLLVLFTLFLVFGMACFQPFLVTGIGPFIAWLAIYCIFAKVKFDNEEREING